MVVPFYNLLLIRANTVRDIFSKAVLLSAIKYGGNQNLSSLFSKCLINDICRIIKITVLTCIMLMLTGAFCSKSIQLRDPHLKNIFLVPWAYADAEPVYPGVQPKPLIDIRDVINVKGPDNTKAVTIIPKEPLTVKSNAVDAVAEDFIDIDTSLNQASIFAAVSIDKPYEHTYQGCNRFAGYTLDDAYTMGIPVLLPGPKDVPQFWFLSMSKKGIIEKAFTFMIYVNETQKTFTVDSFWRPADIPAPKNPDYNYIFNIQIWAASQQVAYNLLDNILSGLSKYDGWQVKYVNTHPIKPPFFIMDADIAKMRVRNMLPQAQKVTFTGYMRYPDNKDKTITTNFDRMLDPGLNVFELPFTKVLDGSVIAKANNFTDSVYVGRGRWLAFGKNMTKTESQELEEAVSSLAGDDFLLVGAGIEGKIPANGRGGLARTLNPNSLPVDISRYNCLSFWAKGDGNSYRVQFETESVRSQNSSEFHQFVIATDSEWRKYIIPFSSLSQDPNRTVPFTGTDVISVAWETIGAPLDSIKLEIKNAAFINTDKKTCLNLTIGSSKMLVNGAVKDIDPGYQTAPTILNGRTMVPIRAIIESLGGTVDWSASDQKTTITLKDTAIVLWIGEKSATINGVDKTIDNTPILSATGRTMMPLRFITENLGHSVDWDDSSETIAIQ